MHQEGRDPYLLLYCLFSCCCSNSCTVERLLDDLTEQQEAQQELVDALQQNAAPAEEEACQLGFRV